MSETARKVQPSTGSFSVSGDIELHERHWELGETAKAHIVIVHGYGEHCARYDHVAAFLNSAGYSVHSYDQRSHGNSPGKKGFIASFESLTADLGVYMNRIAPMADSKPLFIMGHSMGGLVLASYAIRSSPKVKGLVFSSSAVKVPDNVSVLLRKISGILAVLLPNLPVHELDVDGLSHDPEVIKRYTEDPLVYHGKFAARTAHELTSEIAYVESRLDKITLPFIALHGTEDRLAECEASRSLHANAGSADKTLKIYEGAYHEVFNDTLKDQFLSDLVQWLDARC